jgi:hypothetical protein
MPRHESKLPGWALKTLMLALLTISPQRDAATVHHAFVTAGNGVKYPDPINAQRETLGYIVIATAFQFQAAFHTRRTSSALL